MEINGAMLGGYLLPKEEFISIMNELIIKNRQQIIQQLDIVLQNIELGNIKSAYKNWDIFQTQILKNPTTSLLAILNFYGNKKDQSWTFVNNELDSIKDETGKISLTSISDDLKKEYLSLILTRHLSKLFKEIESPMEKDEINFLWGLEKKELQQLLENGIKDLNKGKQSKQYTYKPIIYGKSFGRFYNGKVADAFLNHLGGHHWTSLNSFFQTGNDTNLSNLNTHGVKMEERAINSLNFVKLLMASNNRVPWYSGGDLIVVNESGKVLANIQLKTSSKEGEWVGNIRINALKKELIIIKQSFTENVQNIAELFFEMLKTSAQIASLGDIIIDDVLDLVRENLNLI